MKNETIEIERKYIIELPDISLLRRADEFSESEILQIYLESVNGVTHRIRRRKMSENVSYTETKKVRIDKCSAFEDERRITHIEFDELRAKMDKNTSPIIKKRYTFVFRGQMFEIDVYPQWKRTAILETELDSREKSVDFPDFIRVLREVTGDRRYSNAGMSRSFPEETVI